jgi:hypothetical protein
LAFEDGNFALESDDGELALENFIAAILEVFGRELFERRARVEEMGDSGDVGEEAHFGGSERPDQPTTTEEWLGKFKRLDLISTRAAWRFFS